MKKYLTRIDLKPDYVNLAEVEEVELVYPTPKGWKLKLPSGRIFFYNADRYVLFDTDKEARDHLLKLAKRNIETLKHNIAGWQALVTQLKD